MGDSHLSHLDDGNNSEEDKESFVLLKESTFLLQTEDEYIKALVSKESSNFGSRVNRVSEADGSHWSGVRSDCARWVLKMKTCFGFGDRTAYLAMSYYDQFLVRRGTQGVKIWAIKLLSIACLSLAAKIEESSTPALLNYQLDDYVFRGIAIQNMELLVLDILEWKMRSVTPFSYLNYFASKFECTVERNNLLHVATGFIFSILEAVNLVDCRPSTMAAAAILAASSDKLTKNLVDSKMSMISLLEPLESEHVYSCYTLMIQESLKEKLKPPKLLVPSDVSANNETASSEAGNKRRRLQSPNIQ